MTAQPLVSVLMTAYNREKYIAEAIESVLASEYQHFELIIVDDHSTDQTLAIAQRYKATDHRVSVFSNEKNIGQFKNRNLAATYARGFYLKYFDSDDVMYPHCLSVMVSAMEKFPEVGAGAVCISGSAASRMLPVQYMSRELYVNHYFNGNPLLYIGPSGCIYRKNAFDAVGGFDEETGILADTLFMLRVAARYSITGFQDNLFHWRVHEERATTGQRNWFEMQRQRYAINERILHDPGTPFSKEEQAIVRRNMKNILVRNILKRLVIHFSFAECLSLSKLCKLRIQDYLKALLPNKSFYLLCI